MSRRRRRTSRRAPRQRSRSLALIGSILLLVAIFIPNFIVLYGHVPGQYFPSTGLGIYWPWLDIFGILVLIMGILGLIGVLIDSGDITLVLCVIAGIIGLIAGVVGLIELGVILALGPMAAILGGLLTLIGALRLRV
jgi:hypothetical protein